MRINPYSNLDNITNGVVITFTDITVEKCLEQELEEKHRETCNLVHVMPHGFALLQGSADQPGAVEGYCFESINPGFEALLGLSEASLAGKCLKDAAPLLGTALGEALKQSCRRVIEKGGAQAREISDAEHRLHLHLNVYRVAGTRLACMVVDLAPAEQGRG